MAARSRSSRTRPHAAAQRPADRPDTNRPTRRRTAWWGPAPEGCGRLYVDKVHEHDPATPETAHLYGFAEPRLCTPPLRELTPDTSLGFDVIDFADEVLGIILLPWQRAALIRMLELLEDGSLRFDTVLVLVARQNGKSTLAQVLTVWLLVVWKWPLVLGTAQDLDVAETLWQEVVDMVQDDPELAEMIRDVVKVNGKKALVLDNGTKYKVKAANRRAGRGLSGNLILLDELREHQTWDAWAAITKTTMARAESLILALSNAGDITSRVLRYLRTIAHRALGDPDGIIAAAEGAEGPTEFDLESAQDLLEDDVPEEFDEFEIDIDDLDVDDLEQDGDTLCILEWSAPPGCDRKDRAGWSHANPSRRYTIGDRKIAAALKEPEWVMRTEVLCQWNDGATSGPFAPGSWQHTTIEVSKDADGRDVVEDGDQIVGPVVAGVAQAGSRAITYVALAGYRADGLPQVEIVAARYGAEWVAGWLTSPDRTVPITQVTGQTRGAPESTLMAKLIADDDFRMPVVELVGQNVTDAYADTDDAIRELRVRHPPNSALDLAAQTAEWKILSGGTRVLDSVNSPIDIAPLRAWIAAFWLLTHQAQAAAPPPPVSRVIKRSSVDRGEVDLATFQF